MRKQYSFLDRVKAFFAYPIAVLADGGVCVMREDEEQIQEDISNLWYIARYGYDKSVVKNCENKEQVKP